MLGKICIDEVSGFTGVCIACCEYYMGNSRVLLQPAVTAEDQKLPESQWFTIATVSVIGDVQFKHTPLAQFKSE